MSNSPVTPVSGLSLPNLLLRLEGLTMLAAAVILFAHLRGSGLLFAVLFLLPDVGMIGYRANPRVGSLTYNALHFYALPAVLLGIGTAANIPTAILVALIWFAHIGFDRILGFGLKYPNDFKDSHFQHV